LGNKGSNSVNHENEFLLLCGQIAEYLTLKLVANIDLQINQLIAKSLVL
jgi:hypothetical protein